MLVCKRGFYDRPSIATLLARTALQNDLSVRVAAVDQLRERAREMTRVQRSTYEMSLAEVIEDVRRAGIVKARGMAFVVNRSGQLVSALPLT